MICKLCGKDFKNGKLLGGHLKKEHPEINKLDYLRFYHYDKKMGFCLECGKEVRISFSYYNLYCSNKCKHEYESKHPEIFQERYEKTKQTCLKKYGVDNFFKAPQFQDLSKQTCLKKYGVEYSFQSENNKQKSKETNLKKYGAEYAIQSDLVKQKSKETNLKKYGNENFLKSDYYKSKKKETWVKKYGVDHPWKIKEIHKKSQDTNLVKYGCKAPLQNKEIQDLAKQTCIERYGTPYTFQSDLIKEKSKQTCLDLYGVEYSFQSDLVKQKAKETNLEKYGADNYTKSKAYLEKLPEILEKIYKTKKQNHTFNTSTPEEFLYSELVKKFGISDILRQYKSPKYPYNCDFYIKSLDLYIELQGTWLHGKEPYNPDSKKHQQKLLEWQEKAKKSKFYKNAIKIWTIKDPLKRKIALENNLNYIEVFDFETFGELKNILNFNIL